MLRSLGPLVLGPGHKLDATVQDAAGQSINQTLLHQVFDVQSCSFVAFLLVSRNVDKNEGVFLFVRSPIVHRVQKPKETQKDATMKVFAVCMFVTLVGMLAIEQAAGEGRSISWTVQDREVEFESSFENGGSSDDNGAGNGSDNEFGPEGSVKFRLDANVGSDLKVNFEFESERGLIETESELQFRPEVIVEYVDTNGDGALSPGEWRYNTSLKTDGWNTFACTSPGVGASVKVYVCTISHATLNMEFKFSLSNVQMASVVAGATAIDPSMLKIDMAVANFPYQVASMPSRLALVSRITSKSSVGPRDDIPGSSNVEKEVEFGQAARFSWVKLAMNGNSTMPVIASSMARIDDDNDGDDVGEYDITFSFAQDNPVSIMWDPEIGSSDNPIGSISPALTSLPAQWCLLLTLSLSILFLGIQVVA